MAERKTKPNGLHVVAVLNGIPAEQQRQDCFTIVDLMRNATMAEPRMWGSRIVGFSDTHSTSASGRSGAWFLVGFAPRKHNLTLSSSADGLDRSAALLQQLGKHATGTGCLSIQRLADGDLATLRAIVERSGALTPTASMKAFLMPWPRGTCAVLPPACRDRIGYPRDHHAPHRQRLTRWR